MSAYVIRYSTFLLCIYSKLHTSITFKLVHQPSAEASNLLGRSYGQKSDLGESLFLELSKTNAPDNFLIVFQKRHGLVIPVKDQLDYVLFGHLRQLPGEDVLQVEQVF